MRRRQFDPQPLVLTSRGKSFSGLLRKRVLHPVKFIKTRKMKEKGVGGEQVLGAEVEHGSQNLHNQDSGGFQISCVLYHGFCKHRAGWKTIRLNSCINYSEFLCFKANNFNEGKLDFFALYFLFFCSCCVCIVGTALRLVTAELNLA